MAIVKIELSEDVRSVQIEGIGKEVLALLVKLIHGKPLIKDLLKSALEVEADFSEFTKNQKNKSEKQN